MNAKRTLVLTAMLALLSACSLPAYKPTGSTLIGLNVIAPSSQGYLVIRKLDDNCELQSTFPNIIGKHEKMFLVDPGSDFSFQLVYVTPYLIGCEIKNTIPSLSDKANYRITFLSPQVGEPKDKRCAIKLEVIDPPPFEWKSSDFSGRCAKNERF